MKRSYTIILALLAFSLSCKKTGTPNDEVEHDAVNAVDLVFKLNGATVATYTAEDPDGDGGNPPTRIDRIRLQPGKEYTSEVVLRSLANGTTKVVTSNITAQAAQHEFYYLVSGTTTTVTKTDKDPNGYPLGITALWNSSSAGTGSVLLKLMHKPIIKGPNDDPGKGHTDLAISFPLDIQ